MSLRRGGWTVRCASSACAGAATLLRRRRRERVERPRAAPGRARRGAASSTASPSCASRTALTVSAGRCSSSVMTVTMIGVIAAANTVPGSQIIGTRNAAVALAAPAISERLERQAAAACAWLIGSRPSTLARASAALDLRPRDDVVGAVRPAHPGLVAAVVVVAQQHERRRLAQRRERLARPRDPPRARRGRTRWTPTPRRPSSARCGPGGSPSRRQRHQHVHDRALEVRVGRVAGRAHAADRALEQRVAGEDVCPRRAARASRGCGRACAAPGRGARRPRARRPAEVARRAVDQLALVGMDEHLRVRPAVEQVGQLRDVVAMAVGEEDMRAAIPFASACSIRGGRAPGVDEESLAAGRRRDEVCVRQAVGCIERSTIMAREPTG